jgi:hypothetical protein
VDHLDDLALGLAQDIHPAARHRAQEAFLLQQRHGLANRRSRDAQRFRQLFFVQTDFFPRTVDVRLRNRLPQFRVRLIAQRNRGVDRLQRERQPVRANFRPVYGLSIRWH